MIAQQDFRFKDSIRLWRLPSQRLRQGLDEVTLKKYNTAHYHAVCGRIVDVNFADNGVPYIGGARYHIDWEDGYTEPAVPASDLLALYMQTPASLGTGSVLDVGLREMLVGLGEALGLLIEGVAEGPETGWGFMYFFLCSPTSHLSTPQASEPGTSSTSFRNASTSLP